MENIIARSLVAIGRESPFTIDLSPARSREGTSEGKKALYHFEAEYPLMFIQREIFNILVSERSLIHREIRNKSKLIREFDARYIVVVRKQVKSSRKYGIAHKLVFKTNGPYIFLEKAPPISYWLQYFTFCEGLGRPGRKMKEFLSRMEKI